MKIKIELEVEADVHMYGTDVPERREAAVSHLLETVKVTVENTVQQVTAPFSLSVKGSAKFETP